MQRRIRPLSAWSYLPRRTSPIASRCFSSSFDQQPSPPRLPPDQQAEFERLQRAAEEALSSHNSIPLPTSSSSAPATSETQPVTNATTTTPSEAEDTATATLSGGIRKGAPPEFTGEKNPKTGEVGGPKNEPLRWGSEGDWSFNGRVTDF